MGLDKKLFRFEDVHYNLSEAGLEVLKIEINDMVKDFENTKKSVEQNTTLNKENKYILFDNLKMIEANIIRLANFQLDFKCTKIEERNDKVKWLNIIKELTKNIYTELENILNELKKSSKTARRVL